MSPCPNHFWKERERRIEKWNKTTGKDWTKKREWRESRANKRTLCRPSDTTSFDHLVMREFVSDNAAGDLRQHLRPYTHSMFIWALVSTNGKHSPTWRFLRLEFLLKTDSGHPKDTGVNINCFLSSTSFDQKKNLKTAIFVFSCKGLKNPIQKSWTLF